MRYMMIYRTDPSKASPPTEQQMMEMGKFIEEMAKAGILLATDGLLPSSKGDARVRQDHGKTSVTDGPFTETKELIAGFAIVQLKTRDEAIDVAKRFLKVAGDGESEIRQMYDEPAYPRK